MLKQLIPNGGTVAPVIIASDKTQLTNFSGNKSAYPVYLTLGNLPKSLRRKPGSQACVLIAYLSVDKAAKDSLSQVALRLRNYEIFHRSMAIVLDPLKKAGKDGVEMVSGDGAVRWVYPLLATYVADYPEQCLVTCSKYGTCPKCRQSSEDLEVPTPGSPRKAKLTYEIIQEARSAGYKNPSGIYKECMSQDVAGAWYEPFWVGFPLTDIHRCIAPDILHQLYQGVLKHLVEWIQKVVGAHELDVRIRALPPACGVRYFKNGISGLSQVSGTERKEICKVLLSCLVGKMDNRGILACRSLIHFIHLAQYTSHDEETLHYMETELNNWHRYRGFFITSGVRQDFNIPKFHSLLHYVDSIRWLGTTDNYNTEMFERLHIDFAKLGWRASNKRDHFPQMIKWLGRQERVAYFDFYKSWMEEEIELNAENDADENDGPKMILKHKRGLLENSPKASDITTQLAKFPSEIQKSIARIRMSHEAPEFEAHLKIFLASLLPTTDRVRQSIFLDAELPFSALDVWHRFKLIPNSLGFDHQEVIKAMPSFGDSIARFDTVMILDTDEAESTAVQGMISALVESLSYPTVSF